MPYRPGLIRWRRPVRKRLAKPMFICPACKSALGREQDDLTCRGCAARYPIESGVPILIPGVAITRTQAPPSRDFARDVALIGSADPDDALIERLRDCFSLRFEFPDPVLQVESEQFLNRLRSSGFSIREPFGTAPAKAHPPPPRAYAPARVRLEVSPLIVPEAVRTSETFSFNVRLRNAGCDTLSSRHRTPVRLSYHWAADSGGREEGLRTDLLIDLPPGRGITMPVRAQAPRRPGRYRLELTPLIEHVAWLDDLTVSVPLRVSRGWLARKPRYPWRETATVRGYAEDHRFAVGLLSRWLGERSKDPPRMLEVGGNFHPMIDALRGERYNVDIDPFGLIARNAMAGGPAGRDGRVVDLVADGFNLPFPDRWFDAVALFATFHHFPDPVGLLKHLAAKVKPDGLVCLMCEPVGHVFAETLDEDLRRELDRGAYEQVFQPWEYAAMLRAAGLRIVDGVMDVGSAKIAARPASDQQG